MSIASQAHVNVLKGTLGSAFVDGKPGGDNELPNIADNALENPMFDTSFVARNGNVFNGVQYLGAWAHWGNLFTAQSSYGTYSGTIYEANFPAFKDLGGGTLGDQKKVLKLFGSGTKFPTLTGTFDNTDNTRSFPNIPVVGFTSAATPSSGATTAWYRHEWAQGIEIPDDATSFDFGAYIRCPEGDELRDLNCGGVYIWQKRQADTAPIDAYIDAIVAKKSGDTLNLLTGDRTTGLESIQNWSAFGDKPNPTDDEYDNVWNDTAHIESINYVNNTDHRQFRQVRSNTFPIIGTGTVSPRSGGRLKFAMFFGENQSNTDDGSGENTGAIEVYNPFVIFNYNPNYIAQFTYGNGGVTASYTDGSPLNSRVTTNDVSIDFSIDANKRLDYIQILNFPNAKINSITGGGTTWTKSSQSSQITKFTPSDTIQGSTTITVTLNVADGVGSGLDSSHSRLGVNTFTTNV